MTFDLKAFKASWRALAAEQGVDPDEGATGYQVASAQAEARKRAVGRQHWWRRDPDLWADPGYCRNELEYEVFYSLFQQAWRSQAARIRIAEPHRKAFVYRPLREIYAKQGLQLLTVECFGEPIMRVLIPIA